MNTTTSTPSPQNAPAPRPLRLRNRVLMVVAWTALFLISISATYAVLVFRGQ